LGGKGKLTKSKSEPKAKNGVQETIFRGYSQEGLLPPHR